ncbi:DUF2138 family protein [Massilia sp. Dwa41.01b]|nr:DUF2138 family protein [Massilia sp. Dwa41.01b]
MNKRKVGKVLIACVLSVGAFVTYRSFSWDYLGRVNSLELDLSKPDALILTPSLSTLPRDLLTIPLARDVLREDFVFYYEQGEDRLGLKGSLRRIAYEHELNWGDELIRMVLDQPAEVALWRDADGTLKHYAIAVTRGNLARLLEEAGKVALKDTQLRRAGELAVGADKVPVYALDYGNQRTLLFAARGERMVILSHPGMLYGVRAGARTRRSRGRSPAGWRGGRRPAAARDRATGRRPRPGRGGHRRRPARCRPQGARRVPRPVPGRRRHPRGPQRAGQKRFPLLRLPALLWRPAGAALRFQPRSLAFAGTDRRRPPAQGRLRQQRPVGCPAPRCECLLQRAGRLEVDDAGAGALRRGRGAARLAGAIRGTGGGLLVPVLAPVHAGVHCPAYAGRCRYRP